MEEKDVWDEWRKIWKLRVHNRLKVSAWILAHGNVLSNWSRWKRKLAINPSCTRCEDAIEDSIHAVRDCPKSRVVWQHFVPHGLSRKFFSWNLREWLSFNLRFKKDKNSEYSWPETMVIIMWDLWKWRCGEVMRNEVRPLISKIKHIRLSIKEMRRAFEGSMTNQRTRENIPSPCNM